MTKHKTMPLFWAAFSLLFIFNVMPGAAQRAPDTLFNCTWTAAPVAPALLLDAPVVTVGTNMYLFGGVQGGAISAASFKFDGNTSTWSPIAPLPAAVEFAAAVTDGTDIYILGGALTGTGTPQTTLTKYNVALNTYTALAPFTTGTWNHSAVYLAGKIYKWAGTGPATASASALEIYTVATNTWAPGAAYPLAISFTSGWTQGGQIYSAGGIASATTTASNKTFHYNPATDTWDDASIADLPDTRWGAGTAFYSPDPVLVGGYVAGVVTANISNTAISWDLPSNTWNSIPNALQARSRMTAAVLNGSVYAVGGRCTTVGTCDAFQGTNDNQKLTCLNVPTNIISNGGSAIINAGPNGVLDPGESVTVSLYAQNTGGPGVVCTTAALTGTLQASGGVTLPSAPQVYGVLCSGSGAVHREFTFTVDPALPCGNTVTASLQMQDGATNYGTLSYPFLTGSVATSFTENFDGVVAPALPAGWTTTFSGTGTAVATSTVSPDTAPNDIFLSEATNVGLSEVATPSIAVSAGGASKLTFRNLFNTESTFDGLVLEISINGGAFSDILAAGGTFASGGYNSTLSTGFNNPLPGRMAWTGLSGGTAAAPTYITTVVNLPAAASGQSIKLMWRQGSDNSVAPTNPGSRIDTISIASPVCGGSAPVPTGAVSHKVHGAAGPFDINLPLVALNGVVGIEDRSGAVAGDHQEIVTFPAATTVGGVSVTTGTGSVGSFSVAPGVPPTTVVTINLTGVANAQRLGVTLANVSSGASLGSVQVPMGVLAGDTNASGGVSAADVSQTKAQSGNPAVLGNFRTDVNVSGGVSAADISLVKARSGNLLPP